VQNYVGRALISVQGTTVVWSTLISTRNDELDPTFVSIDRIRSREFHIIPDRSEQETAKLFHDKAAWLAILIIRGFLYGNEVGPSGSNLSLSDAHLPRVMKQHNGCSL
jgi:hypothetical protein